MTQLLSLIAQVQTMNKETGLMARGNARTCTLHGRCRTGLLVGMAALVLAGALAASAQAASPAWKVLGVSAPTNLPPQQGPTPGEGNIVVYVTNVGGEASSGEITLQIGPLPEGIKTAATPTGLGWSCTPTGAGQETVTCGKSISVGAGITTSAVVAPVTIGSSATEHSSFPISIVGGGALAGGGDIYSEALTVSSQSASSGVGAIWAGAFNQDGRSARAAVTHPNQVGVGFMLNTLRTPSGRIIPSEDLKDFEVELPPGFVGNPTVTNKCPQSQIVQNTSGEGSSLCPSSAVVGQAEPVLSRFDRLQNLSGSPLPIYNDEPPFGFAAEFSFPYITAQASVVGSLRDGGDYGVTATAPNVPLYEWAFGAFTMFSGYPASSGGKPFFTNPSNCAEQALTAPVIRVNSNTWEQPSVFHHEVLPQPTVNECDKLHFTPAFSLQPETGNAASNTGATAHLHVDQTGLLEHEGTGQPHLKRSVVALPEGLRLNPAAADGLESCSTAQIGLKGTQEPMPSPIRFSTNAPACPDGSKIGTAEIKTPLLDQTLDGTVYLAAQDDNPFHSLIAMYLVIDNPRFGLMVKIPGKVEPNSQTGQLTAVFDNNPQLPFEDLTLKFRGGAGQPRSTLATPDVCAKYTTTGSWTPWSAPESGPAAPTSDPFEITKGVGGSASCPHSKSERPFNLNLSAGVSNVNAGQHSPFTFRLTRPDGNQEFDKVSVTTPPGLAASFKGVATCSDAAVAAAGAASRTGKEEIAHPSCPASSQIGTTTIGAGVGSSPLVVKTGKVYLTGPYKGSPLSFTFIVPAVAGPFDLGVQVVRTAININPKTAQVTAVSDSIPTILKGIPLLIRSIQVDIDRSNFILNPTSCNPMSIGAQVNGNSGAVANLSNRFQVGNCGALGFKPNLKLQLHGGTKRADYQKLTATVTYPKSGSYANVARAAVTLPHSEFLAQEHIRTVCTRVQFAAHACPKGSIYGQATAITPLLEEPLSGPVYLRSSDNPLPDLVAALRGPDSRPIEVELAGRTDSKNGGIRNTFDVVPDAPVSKFTLQLQGGKKSLIVNSRDLCNGPKQYATARFTAQNGKERDFRPVVGNDCGKQSKQKGSKRPSRLMGKIWHLLPW